MMPEETLAARLTAALGEAPARALAAEVERAGRAAAALALLDELREASSKVAQAAIEALPELRRRAGLGSIVAWLDLGVTLAGSSGAAALRYFKDSPLVLGLIEAEAARETVLQSALELADGDPNVALELFRRAPELMTLMPPDRLSAWAEVGVELARVDYVLGIEFLKQSPAIARVVPLDQARAWAAFGAKLTTTNSLGKPDYVGTLEFFRTSPALLGEIDEASVRPSVIALGSQLADRDPAAAIECLAECPALLRRLPGEAWRRRVLQCGVLIAERDAAATLAYLRRCPEIIALIAPVTGTGTVADDGASPPTPLVTRHPSLVTVFTGLASPPPPAEPDGASPSRALGALSSAAAHPSSLITRHPSPITASETDKFDAWFRGGMEVLEFSAEGARAYFALETNRALASVEEALSGVSLRRVARSLKLFAQGLCGMDVTIRSAPDSFQSDAGGAPLLEASRPRTSPDGRTIYLPSVLRRHPSAEDNVRLYTVMVAHEAGHLEFGTYALNIATLADLIADVRIRYKRGTGSRFEVRGSGPDRLAPRTQHPVPLTIQTLAQVFDLYPQPGVARDLWTVLEDARVEHRLRRDYPGLARDLAIVAREAVRTRSLQQGLSVRELVVDHLLLLTTAEPGAVTMAEPVRELVERLWDLSQTVLTPTATAEDVIRLVDRLYRTMDEAVASSAPSSASQAPSEQEPPTAGPSASETITGRYRSLTNWNFRGAMQPELIRDRAEEPGGTDSVVGPGCRRESEETGAAGRRPDGEQVEAGRLLEDVLAADSDPDDVGRVGAEGRRRFLYDEWDGLIRDYRAGWCEVVERPAPEGSPEFVTSTLSAQGPAVRLLRRYFESLRPPGLRMVRGRQDGDVVDLDEAIRRAADRRAGAEPSDRIYQRRETRERDVAALFLVDLSGSTSRQVRSDGRRVIDVEKEGLVLLAEALSAIGDPFAIYGYSGRGRRAVELLAIKGFDEAAGAAVSPRIGALAPMQQNRDGAAIRHAVRKLRERRARTRLLVVVSDGRPLDDGYADEYSLEDTKMALREARLAGVTPFCITVDRGADAYLRRMYGDVRYLVIDRAEALPELLPKVYHRLTA
jgi:hypothetical protein